MFAPHIATIYIITDSEKFATILEGVFLNSSRGTDLVKTGLESADKATLYIPFDCRATNAATGQVQKYCPPKAFERLENKSGFWTVRPDGRASGAGCFFVRGRVVEPDMDFAGINDRHDGVYRVSSVNIRDFGSFNMRHLQIEGV